MYPTIIQAFGFDYVVESETRTKYQLLGRQPNKGNQLTTKIFRILPDNTDYERNTIIRVHVIRKTSQGCQDAEVQQSLIHLYPSTVKYQLFLNEGKAKFLNSTWQSDEVVKRL